MLLASDAVDMVCNAAALTARIVGPRDDGDDLAAAFVTWVGRGMLHHRWPLPSTSSPAVLLETARRRGWLEVERPSRGDVFISLDPGAARAGFVLGVLGLPAGQFRAVTGREDDAVRVLGGPGDETRYVFLRWARGLEGGA